MLQSGSGCRRKHLRWLHHRCASSKELAETASNRDIEEKARFFLDWLSTTDTRWLVVLDDIADPRCILPWWPDSHTGAGWVLATTRRRDAVLTGGGRTLIPVDVYTREESVAYLTRRLIDEGAQTAIDGTAEALAQALGDLPLALSHAAAFIIDQHITCAEYMEAFNAETARLAELMPESADTDDYAGPGPGRADRTVAATWSLSIQAADQAHPEGLASAGARIAAMLDPTGHPDAVWETQAIAGFLDKHRTPGSALCSACRGQQEVTARQARAAMMLLHRFGLVTHDPATGQRAVRMHALAQRATLESTPPAYADELVSCLADALLEIWPETDFEAARTEAIRSNAMRLITWPSNALWEPEAHPILFQYGQSALNTGLAREASEYWADLAQRCVRLFGPDSEDSLSARWFSALARAGTGDARGALSLAEDLLQDQIRLFGETGENTLITRWQIVLLRAAVGDHARAVAEADQLLSTFEGAEEAGEADNSNLPSSLRLPARVRGAWQAWVIRLVPWLNLNRFFQQRLRYWGAPTPIL